MFTIQKINDFYLKIKKRIERKCNKIRQISAIMHISGKNNKYKEKL